MNGFFFLFFNKFLFRFLQHYYANYTTAKDNKLQKQKIKVKKKN